FILIRRSRSRDHFAWVLQPIECHENIVFSQAEDGIRYRNVTGVQTCALPIYSPDIFICCPENIWRVDAHAVQGEDILHGRGGARSEERRVGKECRSRWAATQEKKKEM